MARLIASQLSKGRRIITVDRTEWKKYLKDNNMDYRIRIKSDAQIRYQGKQQSVKQWFSHLQVNRTYYLRNCHVYGNQVNLAVKRLKGNE